MRAGFSIPNSGPLATIENIVQLAQRAEELD